MPQCRTLFQRAVRIIAGANWKKPLLPLHHRRAADPSEHYGGAADLLLRRAAKRQRPLRPAGFFARQAEEPLRDYMDRLQETSVVADDSHS